MDGSPSSTAADGAEGERRPLEERPDVGAAPKGPGRLRTDEYVDVVKRTAKEFMADDCMGLAQQVAFSSLLAFFPSVILLVGLLGLFGSGAYDALISLLGPVSPKAVVDTLNLAKESSAQNPAGSAIAFVLGLVGAVWAASSAMGSVIKAVNRAYDKIEMRPFWMVRATAIVLVVLTGLVTAAMFLLLVFGGPIGDAIAKRAGLGDAFNLVWNILRWPIGFVAVMLFFSLVYFLAPNLDQRNWRWVTPGSAAGALLWVGVSGLFALYTSFSSSYDRTYGSLAGGIILLLWLYYSSLALLFGAELNAELDRQADIHAAGGPNAGLVKPARRVRA